MAEQKKSGLQHLENGLEKFGEGICTVFSGAGKVAKFASGFKKIWLALPVVFGAVYLAIFAGKRYPEYVGLSLMDNGDFGVIVTRQIAIMGPLAITAVCLLLMFCSRRQTYPWLISLFSLILPVILLIAGMFPG